MQQIYFRLSDLKIESILLKKIGITIRKISDSEIDIIVNNVFTNVFNNDVNNLIKIGKKYLVNKNYDFERERDRKEFEKFNNKLENYSEKEKYAILGLINLKSSSVFTTKKLKNSLKEFYTLDVDEKSFIKYYDLSNLKQILLLILDFTRFLSSDELISDIKLNYSKLFEFENINLVNFQEYVDGIITDKYVIKYDYEKFILLINLLNTKDIHFVMSFLTSISFLNNSNTVVENDILNKVSLIERLIVKENSEKINEQFVLKVGTICFDGPINSKYLSGMLKSIYEIRSIIVHGNDKLFFEKIDSYAKKFAVSDMSASKYENKKEVLTAVRIFLDILLKYFLNKYISNNPFCEYIKLN